MNEIINKKIVFEDLGLIDYQSAWDYQTNVFDKTVDLKIKNRNLPPNQQVTTNNSLLFCEHNHVYTLGKSGKESNLLLDQKGLLEANAQYFKINRGGDITYHGPGQIVAYPIFDLENFFTDIHKYMRFLEEAVINVCSKFGVQAGRIDGLTGVWISDGIEQQNARKICAMGVKTSRWVTMHGLAFNVNTNLDYFKNIVPCGIDDKAVTSLEVEIGQKLPIETVKSELLQQILQLFESIN